MTAAAARSEPVPAVALIPARFGSTRFPGKPLANETGKFLIQHVYERAAAARRINSVIVATDDERIAKAVESFGGRAVMTRPDHASGTDRLAEAAESLDAPLVVNVQGDEPEIDPADIDALVALLAESDAPMATLACPFPPGERADDPNLVKVVLRRDGRALYFSRSVIPHRRDAGGPVRCLLHRGIYAYRREFLLMFPSLEAGELERIEKLEQLRTLEHGYDIAVGVVASSPGGIDTPEQYAAFVRRCKQGAVR